MTSPDALSRHVEFFFDPACPFCWQTSKWFRQVQSQVEIEPVWRFISLAMLNEEMDRLEEVKGHAVGHKMLRVAAAAKSQHGEQIVGALYEEMGRRLWETAPEGDSPLSREQRGQVADEHKEDVLGQLPEILEAVGLPPGLQEAASDSQYDAELQASTDEAMERTGGNVGTPILAFGETDGPAFFGPVISGTPDDEDAVKLWDAVGALATFDGFAELKRSLRDPLDNELLSSLRSRREM
ncbi:MAG TPA: DsbA family protein [Ornithinimicrobium sp.]|uniref:mycothiol-dependent nitroreductase Rv2466c family protein n=1 Tax=Ornithinimicrobium sp. TaxID=1977084 RepID=UPI002B4747E1|nr:DsbA family protein [Ornithinimicrobium sp.]HKJ10895.1 DsbA family protein [Ornithinimicrobium sp.]